MSESTTKIHAALLGGVIAGLTIGIPFLSLINCFCCAGILLSGISSVYFYQKDLTPSMPPLTTGGAVQIGALSGAFGAVCGVLIMVLTHLLFGNIAEQTLYRIVYDIYDSAGVLDSIPAETLEEIKDNVMNYDGISLGQIVLQLVVWMLLGPIFGLLGGLLGYSLFRSKTPPDHYPLQARP